jgi:hypothetical protein
MVKIDVSIKFPLLNILFVFSPQNDCLTQPFKFYSKVYQAENFRNLGNATIKLSTYGYFTASVVWWSEFLAKDPEVRIRFPALPDSLRSSESGMWSTQPRE